MGAFEKSQILRNQGISIWAAEDICYIKQLAGCSYLVLQSRMVFEGLTSYSTPISCLHAVLLFDWLAGGWLLWLALAGLAGWVAGWLAGAWLVAGWLGGWVAGWLGGWVAGCIYYMIVDGWYLMDVGSPVLWAWIWPRSDLVLDLVPVLPLNLHLLYWLYQRKTMNIKCLPRIRGSVPTSFYKLYKYDVFDKPGCAPRLLVTSPNKSCRSYVPIISPNFDTDTSPCCKYRQYLLIDTKSLKLPW